MVVACNFKTILLQRHALSLQRTHERILYTPFFIIFLRVSYFDQDYNSQIP
jgi:hypothetical protein